MCLLMYNIAHNGNEKMFMKKKCLCIICKSCNTEINMINIAYECSRKWQFKLNALKSRALEIDLTNGNQTHIMSGI